MIAKKEPATIMKPHNFPKAVSDSSLIAASETDLIVPGKLADESQLGQLTSLFVAHPEPRKTFQAPKPPKKRYLEEILNYSGNNPALDTVDKDIAHVKTGNVLSTVSKELKKEEANENEIPKDRRQEGRNHAGSWRKRLLCWEEYTNGSIEDEKPVREVNNNTAAVKVECDQVRPGRRGRARACKGQKYREFMWTNVIHHRRKSSRWELCQDTVNNLTEEEEKDSFTANSSRVLDNSIDERQQDLPNKTVNGTKIIDISKFSNKESVGVDRFYKKKKLNKKIGAMFNKDDKKSESNQSSSDSDSTRSDSSSSYIDNSGSSDLKSDGLIGSKKRKLRKQSIRRLEPGSSFKDTSVVEESGLATLANVAAKKKKLRSHLPD